MKKVLSLSLIFITVIILYHPALFTYFSQDDFYHFKVSQADTLAKFINNLGIHSFEERGIAFYRPVSRELLFGLYYPIFGLNSLPFRLFSFLIHFLNIYLVYLLVQRFLHKRYLSFFVSFFFGITAANVATLYYLAGGIQTLLATTFTLSCLLLFPKYKSLSFLSFVAAITSHEQAIIIPFLLFGLCLIRSSRKEIRNHLFGLIPYFLAISALLFIEFFKIGFSSTEQQYQAVFDIKRTLNSLAWYSFWALGLPETLIDFVMPGLKLNPNLLKYWGNYYQLIFPSFVIFLILLIISVLTLIFKKNTIFKNKYFLFCLLWFPLGLSPVLLLPLHKSTHYLVISLLPFWSIIGFITFSFFDLSKTRSVMLSRTFMIVFISNIAFLSSVSVLLGSTNYWAANRGRIAEKLITDVKSQYPTLPKGSIIYFTNDPSYPKLTKEWGDSSKQANLVLNGADALQLLYGDPTIKVYYENIQSPDMEGQNIFPVVAKIY